MDVKLHDIGEGMTEGEVIHLLVKVGEHVNIDQPLVEIQTDKMTAELPSPAAGEVTKILVEQGDVISVGTTLMIVEQAGKTHRESSSLDHPSNKKITRKMSIPRISRGKKAEPEEQTNRVEKKGPRRILAAPHTRRLARELGIDISLVEGTGRIGRITDDDVRAYVDHNNNQELESVTPQERMTPTQHVEEIPFKGRRKQIAKKMSQSLFTIPHVTHFDEVDVTELLTVKKQLKSFDEKENTSVNVSMAAFFIKAIALSLKEFPIFNAKLDEEKEVIRLEKSVHIGLATDTDDGLIVPVIRNVDIKSIIDIHREMKTLIKKAKENKLAYSEMTGSTFTISNVGPLGSTAATPIINYPEVGLMAFHKTKKMPVVNEHDDIVIRSMMNLSMSFDHRVADGAKAVAFTNSVISQLQQPYTMLVKLR